MRTMTPQQASWLRYVSALSAYLLFVLGLRFFPSARRLTREAFFVPRSKSDWGWLLSLGFFTFCFSPLLQMHGLAASTAIDNALIVAIEPLMTILLAWLFLRERITRLHLVAFAVAIIGFCFLTALTPSRVAGVWDAPLLGSFLILLSLAGEAVYSVFARKLMRRHLPMAVFGNALFAGTLILTAVTVFKGGLPNLSQLEGRSVWALLFIGPLGTTVTYLFWMIALSRASISSMALTLFIQPLAGTLWGYLFLREGLTVSQAFGGVLILIALGAPALRNLSNG